MKSDDELAPLRNLVERTRVAMVTAVDPAGRLLVARPLATLELDDRGRLWLLVAARTPDVEQLLVDQGRVGVSYADPNKQDYASIAGTANLMRDRERIRSHWNAWVELWFPQGNEDPDLATLCVNIDQAQYWEAPGSTARTIIG